MEGKENCMPVRMMRDDGTTFREIDERCTSLEARLRDMDAHGLLHSEQHFLFILHSFELSNKTTHTCRIVE